MSLEIQNDKAVSIIKIRYSHSSSRDANEYLMSLLDKNWKVIEAHKSVGGMDYEHLLYLDMPFNRPNICEKCNGTGLLYANNFTTETKKCNKCNGNGTLERIENEQ